MNLGNPLTWLMNGLQGHVHKILWVPMLSSAFVFVGNVLNAVNPAGQIDDMAFHDLLQGASSVQMAALTIIMILLRNRKK